MNPQLRRHLPFVVLVVTVMASAVAAVYAKHENRQLFTELQVLTAERDRLEVDWSRLQIDQLARGQMGMRSPVPAELRLVTPEGRP